MDKSIWDIISTVANILMAVIALLAIWQNRKQLIEIKKQNKEDTRARLLFEIVADRDLFLLKITNIGKEPAYNVKLNIKSDLISNHFSTHIRQHYENINKISSTLVPGRSLHYNLSPIKDSYSTCQIGKDVFSSSEINEWLNKYINCPILIKGSYCDKYFIEEELSISGFMAGGSIIVVDKATLALQEISKGLVCRNDHHHSIQENIEDMKTLINKISEK